MRFWHFLYVGLAAVVVLGVVAYVLKIVGWWGGELPG
jgi:hypothetical protein